MSDALRFALEKDRVVSAGAGTGKTYALVTQYLHLVAGLSAYRRPLEPRALAALTFTEKAAGEMRERVSRRAQQLARALAGTAAAELGQKLAALEPELAESARALGLAVPGSEHWERIVSGLPAATIGTFHSFAAALLRRHAALLGIDPEFELLDEDTSHELLLEAAERAVLAALEPSASGAAAAELVQAASLLVSEFGFGGGTSGSTGLVDSLAWLYRQRSEEGLGAEGLAAPYDPARLERERERLRGALSTELRDLAELIPTLSERSAERATELCALRPELDAALASLSRLGGALPLTQRLREGLRYLRVPMAATLRTLSGEVGALFASAEAVPMARGLELLVAEVARGYQAAKGPAGLDFQDLLLLSRNLLVEHPAIRGAVRGRYAAVLVDEFQDTSPLQAQLLELLTAPEYAASDESLPLLSQGGRLFLVGDRKQSIYGFRGADVAAYQQICERRLGAGAQSETLSVSRRAEPPLLRFTNALFSRVFAAAGESGGERAFAVVWDPGRDELAPVAAAAESAPIEPAVEILRDSPPRDGLAKEGAVDDPFGREAALLARRILALHQSGTPFRDVAILLRRFTHLLRYTAALRLAGIPHYVVRGRGFYQAQEVLDLASALAVVDDPEDRLSLVALLRSPLVGLSDDSLGRLHLRNRLGLGPLLQFGPPEGLPRDERERLELALVLLGGLLPTADALGPAQCLAALVEQTDLLAVLAADADGVQRVANVRRLIERARAFEERGGSLRAFVRLLRVSTDPALSGGEPERGEPAAAVATEGEDVVRIMTVHQAKGLEFPVVIVAGCATGERSESLPIDYDREVGLGLKLYVGGERVETLAGKQVRTTARERSIAESARLFYVAATRAKRRLIFSGETRRGRRGERLSGTWRQHLEDFLRDGNPVDGPPLLVEWQGDSASPLPPPPASESATEAAGLSSSGAAGSPHLSRVLTVRDAPMAVTLPAVQAGDLLVCARRFHLLSSAGLPEPASPLETATGRPRRSEELPPQSPLLALHRGTLAGELLSGLPASLFEQPEARRIERELEQRVAFLGLSTENPQVAELVGRLVRFVAKSRLRELWATNGQPAPTLVRALPYTLALDDDEPTGAPLALRGSLDLVLSRPAADGVSLVVLDFLYAPARLPESPLDERRRQILGLVARRLFPAAQRVEVGLCFLRDAEPGPRLRAVEPTDAAPLAAELRQSARLSTLDLATALRLPVLSRARCVEARCGYLELCHQPAATPTDEAEAWLPTEPGLD